MRILLAQRLKLEHLKFFFLGSRANGVGFSARLLRSTKHAGNFITSCEKCIEYRFTKILLSYDCDFHLTPSMQIFSVAARKRLRSSSAQPCRRRNLTRLSIL